jgi:ABC-type branched-subunit amino acid transport system ATPase component
VALSIADWAIFLRLGQVVLSGSASQLAARPEILRGSYLGHDEPAQTV